MPRYSILTPTLCRPSLARTAASILSQTNSDWEWLIAVDVPLDIHPEKKAVLEALPKDDRIQIHECGKAHQDFGNTCRWNLWPHATGLYLDYLDDDDYLADADVLTTLEQVIAPWAIFPVLWHGQFFFNVPPGLNRTGSAMFIARREIARWLPDRKEYVADGLLVEQLIANHPYQILKDVRPLAVLPKSHYGA